MAPVEVAVGELTEFQFFGESALLAESDEEIPHRSATVRVLSEKLELLCLHRLNYLKLMKSTAIQDMFHGKSGGGGEGGGESSSVLERLKSVADQRRLDSELIMRQQSKRKSGVVVENDFSLGARGDQ